MTIEHKKKLGAYYTPKQVTDCLSKWAIRDSSDIVLEPSFGGCNFIISSVETLNNLGIKNPHNRVYGFDIDSAAFNILKQKKLDSTNFFCEDFLKSKYEHTIKPNIILGNPPFLPIHKLDSLYKTELFKQFHKSDFKIPKRSSLWIYFIVHSLRYLRAGGRMAWVVPDSITFTNYGKEFVKQICSSFSSVKIIRIDERYFSEAGTKEKTSFLLCDGYKLGSSSLNELCFGHLQDALKWVSNSFDENKSLDKFDNEKISISKNISNNEFKLEMLGNIFDIKIGIVIGATNLLVLNQQDAERSLFHPNYTYPIITKGKQLNGISINIKKLCMSTNDMPLHIINGIKLEEENPDLYSELLSKIPEKVLLNQTFRKRSRLFGYDDYKNPDAFLTFYAQGLPKFIINENRELNCTNSVHRLYLKNSYDNIIIKFIAIQFFSGLFANDVRNLARLYGNSIYKYEPSDASKIPVIIPLVINDYFKEQIDNVINKIELNLKLNQFKIAQAIALSFISTSIAEVSE